MILTYSFLRFAYNPANVMALDPLDTMTVQVECVSGSMEPGITCLDRLTVAGPAFEDIGIGTIIVTPMCFTPDPDTAVVHRVVAIRGAEYMTMGDNNGYVDDCWIPFDSVYGYVVDVEKRGSPEAIALLDRIWEIEEQRDMLDIAMTERVNLLYEKLTMVYVATSDESQMAYAMEHDALVPTYNQWIVEYDESVAEITSLRAQLQGMRED
jgi:hypothetical protein